MISIILFIFDLSKTNKMSTKELFEGIETAELLSYKINGDTSKELTEEIARRAKENEVVRKNKVNNIKADATFNGL